MNELFGNVIYAYTRKQAIEDGVLIDVTDVAKKVGFTLHTVITTGVHALLDRQPEDCGVLLLSLVGCAFACVKHGITFRGDLDDVDRKYFEFRGQLVYIHCGPGDDAEPVLTIMLDGED